MPDKCPNSNDFQVILSEGCPDLSGTVGVSGLTVNQPPHGFEGSSPSFPTTLRPCGLRVAQLTRRGVPPEAEASLESHPLSFRGARSASPESILSIVVMDSGFSPAGCPGMTGSGVRAPIQFSNSQDGFQIVIASQRVGAKRRPMTGSAKQSIGPRQERMDCFVASLLAMTSHLRDLAARWARVLQKPFRRS
jgi:hypothetical protein